LYYRNFYKKFLISILSYSEKRKASYLIESESVFNSSNKLNTLNNYIAQDSGNNRHHHNDNKNVRFKEPDTTFRPIISEPIPNPSINLKNLQDLPDLRNLKQQMASNNISVNIGPSAAAVNRIETTSVASSSSRPVYTLPSHYESPQVGSRSSNSNRGGSSHNNSHSNSNAQSVDNFENLYSKVSVSSTLKVGTPPSTGKGVRGSNPYHVPQLNLPTAQSTASSMSNRYGDDNLPVYINSNFDDNEV
jgi:hypothetical protein